MQKIPCRYIEKLSVNFRGAFFVDLENEWI